jgi:hypothetical protein
VIIRCRAAALVLTMAHRFAERVTALSFVLAGSACTTDVADGPTWDTAASGGGADAGSEGGSEGDASISGGGGDMSSAGSGADSGGDPSAGGSSDAGDESGGGPGNDSGADSGGNPGTCLGPDDGPCGCGFEQFSCETNFYGKEGTEGPMPPLCGGGSGLGNGAPNECHGGNFGTYADVDSFCSYIVGRWTYLENECGNFGTATLAIDPSLMAIADEEAKAVAGGACPKGEVTCGGSPCGPLDGPRFNMAGGASWLYIDGFVGEWLSKDAMFTAAESSMIIQDNVVWTDQQGNPIYERACQYNTEFANAILFHYCNWEGMGVAGDPTTQPSRVGCGVAVDTDGITWRVVKLGA